MAAPEEGWSIPGVDVTRRDASVLLQVFVAGVGTMALEMLAGRLLAPRFGSTIFVWGAVIGVVLTGLGLGYYVGGRLGDRRPVPSTLSLLLLGGGAFALLMPLFGPPVLAGVASLLPGPRGGPLLAATLLLGPPSLVLGGAAPVAIRLTAGPAERAGTTAGTLFGVSTAGSIVGTFLTVFVLIPALSVTAILTATGALLAGASLLGGERRAARATLLAILLVASPMGQAAFSGALTRMQTGITDEVVYRTSSQYHEIYVVEDRNPLQEETVRTLIMDGLRHSAMYTQRPAETPFTYVEYFHLGPLLAGNASSALFVGGGGMSGPKQFLEAYPEMQVDVVEVDPVVVDVAETYFAVPEDPRLEIHVDDGRQFLQETNRSWDVIVLDAYGRDYIPFHLLTEEFLATVADRLSEEGVVVSNVIGTWTGEASQLVRAEARTMETAFNWTHHVPTQTRLVGNYAQNIMLVAGHGPAPEDTHDLEERARAWETQRGRAYTDIVEELDADRLRLEGVPVLRDGYAPVEEFLNPVTMRPYDPER